MEKIEAINKLLIETPDITLGILEDGLMNVSGLEFTWVFERLKGNGIYIARHVYGPDFNKVRKLIDPSMNECFDLRMFLGKPLLRSESPYLDVSSLYGKTHYPIRNPNDEIFFCRSMFDPRKEDEDIVKDRLEKLTNFMEKNLQIVEETRTRVHNTQVDLKPFGADLTTTGISLSPKYVKAQLYKEK